MNRRALAALVVVLVSALPYLATLDDYFVQDDFGVVWLLSSKPAGYFPRWFISPWMDTIWGDPPDEIRPFPAVTYQIAALWGASSPVANHVINIAFHAVNTLLVLRIAETAAGLPLVSAAFAAVVFAVLPMQSESVAWVTGRVDSMPACFYMAAFLLYGRWRGARRVSLYVWSVVLCFIALFTKQNAVTLPAALVAYDMLVEKRPMRLSWPWLRPYVPYVLLTAGYLVLRYALFGEVAREGRLGTAQLDVFWQNVSIHLRRMVFGEPGLELALLTVLAWVGVGAAAVVVIWLRWGQGDGAARVRATVYFLLVWVALGLAPTIVSGYGSPRHMYLASAGWAVALGVAFDVFWRVRVRALRIAGVALGAVLLMVYAWQLRNEVRLWGIRAEVSRHVVADLEREALAAPRGTLFLVDPPPRSWNFALPYAVKPPFTREDVPARVAIISHSAIHCCAANYWEPYTRQTIRTWLGDPARPPAVVLRWDPDTGQLFRLTETEDPGLRALLALLLEAGDVTALDRLILNISQGVVRKAG